MLFLDELPEFPRAALEALREPLENRRVALARGRWHVTFPAECQFLAAMNPCPCGYLGSTRRTCRCKPEQVLRYQNKLSGPFLDRIDLHVRLRDIDYETLLEKPTRPNETSAEIQKRVVACRQTQLQRQGVINAQLKGKALEEHSALKPPEQKILLSAMRDLQLSPRATHRLMRIARTIADLDHSPQIEMAHISETLSYRS